jgi:hypothetical protein|tara:strand:+ start:3214 stop:3459 length:246 start_codon:yes stop_codon:yes gene_type:complete
MKTLIDFSDKGFNDYECLQQAKVLKKVMFNTKEVKIGRGRKAIVTHEFIFNTEEDDQVREKIINTIKHYEAKLETIPNKNN